MNGIFWCVFIISLMTSLGLGYGLRIWRRDTSLKRLFPDQRFYKQDGLLWGHGVVLVGYYTGIFTYFLLLQGNLGDSFYPQETTLKMIGYLLLAFPISFLVGYYEKKNPGYYRDWLVILLYLNLPGISLFRFQYFFIPFWGEIELSTWSSACLTLIWYLVVVSIVEVLESLHTALTLAVLAIGSLYLAMTAYEGETFGMGLAISLVGSLIGLLPWACTKPMILLGKGGCKLIGVLFATLILIGRQKTSITQILLLPVLVGVLFVVVESIYLLKKRIEPNA